MIDPAQYMSGTLNSGQKARWTRSFSNICSYDGRVSDKRREHHDVYEPTSGHRRDLTTWSPRPSAWFPKLTARWGGRRRGGTQTARQKQKLNEMSSKKESRFIQQCLSQLFMCPTIGVFEPELWIGGAAVRWGLEDAITVEQEKLFQCGFQLCTALLSATRTYVRLNATDPVYVRTYWATTHYRSYTYSVTGSPYSCGEVVW